MRLPHEFEWEVSFKRLTGKFKVWEWSANEFLVIRILSLIHIKNILILGLRITILLLKGLVFFL